MVGEIDRVVRQSVKSMVELFKALRHIKPQALHFYRLYMFSSFRNFRPPAVPEIMLILIFFKTCFCLVFFFKLLDSGCCILWFLKIYFVEVWKWFYSAQ